MQKMIEEENVKAWVVDGFYCQSTDISPGFLK